MKKQISDELFNALVMFFLEGDSSQEIFIRAEIIKKMKAMVEHNKHHKNHP